MNNHDLVTLRAVQNHREAGEKLLKLKTKKK